MLGSSAVYVLLLGLLPHVDCMLQELACLDSSASARITAGFDQHLVVLRPACFCCRDIRLLHDDVSACQLLLWLFE